MTEYGMTLTALACGLLWGWMAGYCMGRQRDRSKAEQSGPERRQGVALVEVADGEAARQLAAHGQVGVRPCQRSNSLTR